MKFDFNSIPKFCISLDKSEDRRKLVQEEFEKYNLSVAFYSAIDKQNLVVPELSLKKDKNANGILACALSHISLLREAKALKIPAICVFEDDVIFCDDFKERIKYIESIIDFDFDFFALGGHFSSPTDRPQTTRWEYIHSINNMNGTYAYIITEKVIDFVLRNYNYNFGMDEFYGEFVYSNFKTFGILPFLCGCRTNKSEITGEYWQYENIQWHYKQSGNFQLITEKSDLSEITFVIPYYIDSYERWQNLVYIINYLCGNFKLQILLIEEDKAPKFSNLHFPHNVTSYFEKRENDIFYRTRVINKGLKMCKTKFACIYDTDVFFDYGNYIKSLELLKQGYTFVYPYDGKFVDIERSIIFTKKIKERPSFVAESFGGAVFLNVKKYHECGLENENIIGWGFEDFERIARIEILGHNWARTFGKCYHIEHKRGINSSTQNPYWKNNEQEFHKVKKSNKIELQNYIKEWKNE